MPGYFGASVEVARALLQSDDGPDLLAGYLVLAEGAYGPERTHTTCGAKAIRTYTGCTDWRSKRTLEALLALRFGDRGQLAVVSDTGMTKANSRVRTLQAWEGEKAFMPAILVKSPTDEPGPLSRLCQLDVEPTTKRDALMLLVLLYSLVRYADCMGAPSTHFFYQCWESEGARESDEFVYDLGQVGTVGDYQIWAVAMQSDDEWCLPRALASGFDSSNSNDVSERIWATFFLLQREGLVGKVAVVSGGRTAYPLWVYGPAFRESLAEQFGISPDLASDIYRLAGQCDGDPDNMLIRSATSGDMTEFGTGVYFCLGRAQPTVRTLVVPRLTAPTPQNLDELHEVARVTKEWRMIVAGLRRKVRSENVA